MRAVAVCDMVEFSVIGTFRQFCKYSPAPFNRKWCVWFLFSILIVVFTIQHFTINQSNVNLQHQEQIQLLEKTIDVDSAMSQTSWFKSDFDHRSCEANGSNWSVDRVLEWTKSRPVQLGCNYIPAYAVNQLEMWQADSYDASAINRELMWAHLIGMNSIRVFLHYMPLLQDQSGFATRLDNFLSIAQENHIQVVFVLFDDCWKAESLSGKQPSPIPGVHNSGWLQCPDAKLRSDPDRLVSVMRDYVTFVVSRFAHDDRVSMWDLWNEPGNSGHGLRTLPLLQRVVAWVRAIKPSQPLTIGRFVELNICDLFALRHPSHLRYRQLIIIVPPVAT